MPRLVTFLGQYGFSALAVFLCVLCAHGCSSDSEDPVDIIEWETFEHTVILDETSVDAITAASDDLAEITFSDAPDQVTKLNRGAVIVGGVGPHSPHGILRTVDAVSTDGDTVTLTTKPASLVHAFRRLRIEVQRKHINDTGQPIAVLKQTLTSQRDDAAVGMSKSAITVNEQRSLGGPIDWVVFDGDGDDATTDDRVRISGELTADIGFTFKLSFDLGGIDIDPFDFPPDIDVSAIDLEISLSTTIGANADLALEGAASLSYEKEVLLGSIPLPAIVVTPVVLIPTISARAGIEGGASSTFQMGLSESISFNSGLAFSVSDGLKPTIKSPTTEFAISEAAVHLGASGKVWVRPELSMLAYGFIGPTAGVEAYARAEAHVDNDPCWTLHGGFDGTVGIALELFGARLVNERISVPIAESQIGSGECTLPPEVTDIEPTFTPSSTFIPDTLATSGSFTDRTDLALSTDGRFVIAASESDRLVKVEGDGTPVWSYSYTDTSGTFDEALHVQTVAPASDGGLLVGARPHALLKLTSAGQLEWAVRPDATGEVKAGFDALTTTPQGALVAGRLIDTFQGDSDVWLIALDATGDLAWSKRWGRDDITETPQAVLAVSDGYVVVGEVFSPALDPASRGFVLRLNSAGDLLWARELVGCSTLENVSLRTATLSNDGDFIVGGNYANPTKSLLAEIQPDGTLSWSAAYRATQSAIGLDLTGVKALDSGGFITAGTYVTAGKTDDIWISAVDSIGRIDWARRYSGTADDKVPALWLTPDNGVVVAAPTGSFADTTATRAGFWMLKVPRKDGQLTFSPTANVTVEDLSYAAITPCMTSETSDISAVSWNTSLQSLAIETMKHPTPHTILAP